MAGAYWGESNIPETLRSGLARRDMLEEALAGILGAGADLCKKLHTLRQTGQSRFQSCVHSAYPFTGRGWQASSEEPRSAR